jgi:aspartokinase
MKIGGIIENRDLTLYRLTSVADQPGAAAEVLRLFAARGVNLEYITEAGGQEGQAVMAVCVDAGQEQRADDLLNAQPELVARLNIKKTEEVSIIGIYGPHFREKPGMASLFCALLGQAGINIMGLSSSISSICGIIETRRLNAAREALLERFELP